MGEAVAGVNRRLVVLAGDKDNEKCRTFVFHNEDHTLGNALRSIIGRYPDVELCAYSMPHPSEPKMLFRIQTFGPPAVEILRRGLSDLQALCDHTLKVFEEELTMFTMAEACL